MVTPEPSFVKNGSAEYANGISTTDVRRERSVRLIQLEADYAYRVPAATKQREKNLMTSTTLDAVVGIVALVVALVSTLLWVAPLAYRIARCAGVP